MIEVDRSCVTGLRRPQYPLLIVFAEKAFSELVRADHDGAGWCNFDQPGEETWQRDDNHYMSIIHMDATIKQIRYISTCKQPLKAVVLHNLFHHAEGGHGRLAWH